MHKEYYSYDKPIVLERYGITVNGYLVITASEGMALRNTEDGSIAVSCSLGLRFRDHNGNILATPAAESPDSWEEITVQEAKAIDPDFLDYREVQQDGGEESRQDSTDTGVPDYGAIVGDGDLGTLKQEKIAEIRAYSSSDNVDSFLIHGQKMWLDQATRNQLYTSVSMNRQAGESVVTQVWQGVEYTFATDEWLYMISAVEAYATKCAAVTNTHINNVIALTSVQEVAAYDYRKGYPEKIEII